MKKKLLPLLALLPILAFASGGEAEGGTDIVARTLNFLIFAAILYYLIANPIKNFFKERREGIASKLEEVQKKVEETKVLKEQAQKELEEAKESAKSLIEVTKKEIELLKEKYNKDLENELALLEKTYEERMEIEGRKVVRETVKEVLDEMFKKGGVALDEKTLVNILLKKAA
ncbi:MAG: F0F1 ATP synthase subunit B [Epsilonproteobacteria bacterium]|nr:F0F1 ATP synthase subunit B [Campylobacterota bacterium]